MLRIGRINDNWNKVNTKEELIELLKGYEGILTEPMLNYLNSLIELEFSVIREYIEEKERQALSELEVYKRIAIYNIYNRTQNLLSKKNSEFIISGNNDGREGLHVSTKLIERNIKLFDFIYKEVHSNGYNTNKIPDGYKTMNIGDISLYQTFESKELREAELDRVMRILERLYDERNPYPSYPGVIGGPGSNWIFDHARKIREYEEKFKQLDSKKELNDEDKREIEITGQIHDLLLEDFDLSKESFVDESNQPFVNFANLGKEKTELKKTLVKRMPNLTIRDNIKYL